MSSLQTRRNLKATSVIMVASLFSLIGLTGPADSDTGGTPLIALGDMADCADYSTPGDPDDTIAPGDTPAQDVADLMASRPGDILLLGDTAYPDGSADDFSNCYDPIFGSYTDRMIPAVGNHEYRTVDAQHRPMDYYNYFTGTNSGNLSAKAGPGAADKLYYETTVGDWQVLVLNTNDVNADKTDCRFVSCIDGSPQLDWLEARLHAADAANPNQCRIIAMHHPRWSSYATYTDQPWLGDIMDLAYEYGTDLVLAGHAHHYERFAPQTPDGIADPANGFQLMILGTGGVPLRYINPVMATSEVALNTYHGLTEFDLRSDSFSWEFIDTDGHVQDSGSRDCINKAPATTTTTAPTTTTTAPPTGGAACIPTQADRANLGLTLGPSDENTMYRAYCATLDRRPDPSGFAYWLGIRQAGNSWEFIEATMADSTEFRNNYGSLDDTAFIERIYNIVLARGSDSEGKAYWTYLLTSGTLDRGQVLFNFSDSPEYKNMTETA